MALGTGRHDAYASLLELGQFNAGLAGFWLSHVDISRLRDFLDAFHAHLEPRACVLLFDERWTPNRRLPTSRTDAVGNRYEMRQLSSGTRFEIIKKRIGISNAIFATVLGGPRRLGNSVRPVPFDPQGLVALNCLLCCRCCQALRHLFSSLA